uniref:Uncharacterized protein n=1 Tax=Arundo donax TaxID=35708 RepID=A0A0A9FVL3_ARUDO
MERVGAVFLFFNRASKTNENLLLLHIKLDHGKKTSPGCLKRWKYRTLRDYTTCEHPDSSPGGRLEALPTERCI